EVLSRRSDMQTHLVMSAGAETTIRYETGRDPAAVAALADVTHGERDLAAPLASGSFLTDGMVIAPCSMRTLSGVANSAADNLITRAADVHLKERRRLVLVVRETPLHAGHPPLLSDATAARAGVLPPAPAR